MADPNTLKPYVLDPNTEEGLVAEDGIKLYLYRWKTVNSEKKVPVLLLHGASVGHEVFTIPAGQDDEGVPRNLAGWLANKGYEPWLLDWRGSKNVVDQANEKKHTLFNFEAAAKIDISTALKHINQVRPDAEQIGAIGFCMGAGTLAQGIAHGVVSRTDHGLTHVVLMTLGLFYQTPVDSRLKAQEHLLERLVSPDRQSHGALVSVDPRVDMAASRKALSPEAWPDALHTLYLAWPGRMKPHSDKEVKKALENPHVLEMCNRLNFMYGMPYVEKNLVQEIHGGADPELPKQFGAVPIHMFIHGSQNIRRGWAGPYSFGDGSPGLEKHTELIGPDAHQAFVGDGNFERITLIGGSLNRLWHRESLDRMYEWLIRGRALDRERYRKVIIPDYGHQDLLWGKNAYKEIFPKIMEGLPPVENGRRSA